MSRLIDADNLGDKVADLYTEGEEATEADKVVNDVIDLIDNAPTVDTYTEDDVHYAIKEGHEVGYGMAKSKYERPTGHWINEHSIDIGYKTAECSCCGERSRLISHDTGFGHKYEYYPFCHWCGADMRGEEE